MTTLSRWPPAGSAPELEFLRLPTRRPITCLSITCLSITRLSVACLLASNCLAVHAHEAATARPSLAALQASCDPGAGPDVALAGVEVQAMPAAPGDLPYYEARSRTSNASVRIYHDPDLAEAAASKAACFMGLLDLLPAAVPEARLQRTWSPLVITRDKHYIPPKRDGELRWVNEFDTTDWSPRTIDFLVNVMPHEETHLLQGSIRLPRWFQEGHAEWAGLQVTEQVRPDLAQAERVRRRRDAAALAAPRLGAWGGIRVKPEAIERQLSAEDRARRARDPGYVPPGPFSFKPEDMAADHADEEGRYGAALALFQELEAPHGRAAVQAWVSAVLGSNSNPDIPALALRLLGEDIAPLLR